MKLYNYYSRSIETFHPIHEAKVGMYVCGPTVYGHPHLGHARSALVFDVLYRVLQLQGHSVRYVRNITDVGHLESEDQSTGEDKLLKQAALEQKQPMELAQYYTVAYHQCLNRLRVLRPSIEPLATGHIPEQLSYIERLLDKGHAYEVNGSVYFDVHSFIKKNKVYGVLSQKKIEDLLDGSRSLNRQDEKKHSIDFALWKQSTENHIMQWKTPWATMGFPGWHTECCAMSERYLGVPFDIHGGGLDLQFPHHEAEIAQSYAIHGKIPANFWVYNNMVTIDGQKMAKSLGNSILISQFFDGSHARLTQAYSPLLLRYMLLHAHYRNTVDITQEAIHAAQSGLIKILTAVSKAQSYLSTQKELAELLQYDSREHPQSLNNYYTGAVEFTQYIEQDLDTPQLYAALFDTAHRILALDTKVTKLGSQELEGMAAFVFVCKAMLGFDLPKKHAVADINPLLQFVIEQRKEARRTRDFSKADDLRDMLLNLGFQIQDGAQATEWYYVGETEKNGS